MLRLSYTKNWEHFKSLRMFKVFLYKFCRRYMILAILLHDVIGIIVITSLS